MVQVRVVVMHNHIIPTVSRHLLLSTAEVGRLVSTHIKAIAFRPTINVSRDVRGISISARVNASKVEDSVVYEAVELHPWDWFPARLTGWQFLVIVQVPGTGYRSKSSNALRGFWVAGEQASETSAIGLSSRVDTGLVDAVCGFEVVQQFECKYYIIDRRWRVWVTLPLLGFGLCGRALD